MNLDWANLCIVVVINDIDIVRLLIGNVICRWRLVQNYFEPVNAKLNLTRPADCPFKYSGPVVVVPEKKMVISFAFTIRNRILYYTGE